MSRLTKLDKNEVSGDVRTLYEKTGRERGKVPGMFRVFAHRPEILTTMVAHLEAVTRSGSVPRKTKELVATLVSRLNRCHY